MTGSLSDPWHLCVSVLMVIVRSRVTCCRRSGVLFLQRGGGEVWSRGEHCVRQLIFGVQGKKSQVEEQSAVGREKQ